jgi:hypothetical protein
MYQKPTQPALIGGVIDDAIKLYRASFRRCAPIAVLGALISAALDLFVVGFAHHEGLPLNGLEAALKVYQQPPVVAMGLLQAVILLALMGALLVTQNAVANGDTRLGVGRAIGIGFTRLGRFVVASVIYLLLSTLGCLLIVPGIYLSNIWSLYAVAMYVEDAGALQSLNASRALTLGYWWHTATVLGAAVTFWLLAALLTDFAAGMVLLLGSADAVGIQSAIQLLGDATDVLVLPILPAATIALYNDLKLRHKTNRLPSR